MPSLPAAISHVYDTMRLTDPRSIRLMSLDHGKNGGTEVGVTLHVGCLDDPGLAYEAISYTWGAPSYAAAASGMSGTPSHPILCNGQPLLVTQNLFDCLDQLIKDDEEEESDGSDRLFWIDAICINQGNGDEKNVQVNLMADIYTKARSVMIWLGKADGCTKVAHEYIRDFAEKSRADSTGTVGRCLTDELKTGSGSATVARKLAALAAFFSMTWFTRVWVVQELVLAQAKTVRCGPYRFDWEHIVEVSHHLAIEVSDRAFPKSVMAAAVGEMGRTEKEKGQGEEEESPLVSSYKNPAKLEAVRRDLECGKPPAQVLLHSLVRFRRYDSAKPHDKVYALLGIHKAAAQLPDAAPDSPLYPHYERDAAEAYIEVAAYILEQSKGDGEDMLHLLSQAEGEDFRDVSGPLPSWVPDWSVKGALGLGITGYTRFNCAAAAGAEQCATLLPPDRRLLELRAAAELDTVTQVGETKEEVEHGQAPAGWIDILLQASQASNGSVWYEPTGQSWMQALGRILTTDTGSNRKTPAPANTSQYFASWLQHRRFLFTLPRQSLEQMRSLTDKARVLGEGGAAVFIPVLDEALASNGHKSQQPELALPVLDDASAKDEETKREAADYDARYSHSLLLRLFRTSRGYIGLGSKSMRVGDSVWIVPGSRVPLIFRPSARTPGRLELVGGAYVHGIMQGEALKENLGFQTIVLE